MRRNGGTLRRHAIAAAQVFTPAMPTIRENENLPWGMLYPVVDGLPRTLGWQWHSDRQAAFVLVGRGRMGGYKILDSFPLTEDGWAAACRSLAETDLLAAEKVMAALAEREAGRQAQPAPAGTRHAARPDRHDQRDPRLPDHPGAR